MILNTKLRITFLWWNKALSQKKSKACWMVINSKGKIYCNMLNTIQPFKATGDQRKREAQSLTTRLKTSENSNHLLKKPTPHLVICSFTSLLRQLNSSQELSQTLLPTFVFGPYHLLMDNCLLSFQKIPSWQDLIYTLLLQPSLL